MTKNDAENRTNSIFNNYLAEVGQTAEIKPLHAPSFDYIGDLDEAQVHGFVHSIDWSFTNNNTTYLSHDIHPYPAKFIPQLPETLIRLLSRCGEMVWDPFGGSGTTALEALLCNRQCISADINPIGALIGKAKTATITEQDEIEIEHFIVFISRCVSNEQHLKNYIYTHQEEIRCQVPDIPNISKWFSDSVVCELSLIKHLIQAQLSHRISQTIAKASFSKLITKVSHQESETRYSAKEKSIPNLYVLELYIKDLQENLAKIRALSRVLGFRQAQFITVDVTGDIVGPGKPIKKGGVDFIVTSPPYPNAFDYHLYHRFRIFWLDGDPKAMGKAEIGSHLKYQKQRKGFDEFQREMRPVLANCFQALKPGKYAAFVLGDAIFDGVLYKTAEYIRLLAESIGFIAIANVDRPIHNTKRSVQSAARRAKSEQILILKKPDDALDIKLIPVKYKMWPYEKILNDMEKLSLCGHTSDDFKMSSLDVRLLNQLTFYKAYQINASEFKTWQSILENGNQLDAAGRKDSKYITHGIHPYKGKFYPQLVHPLLNMLAPAGGVVFDPFCGSGTVLLEAVLNGYHAYGCDINPIAIEIARAKNEIIFAEPCMFDQQLSSFAASLSMYDDSVDCGSFFSPAVLPEISNWFPAQVVKKIVYTLTQINNVPDNRIKRFIRVILSSILRDISQQDPSDLRIRRRHAPLLDAPVFDMLLEGIAMQKKRVLQYAKTRNFSPFELFEANIWLGNSKNLNTLGPLPKNNVDLVITSPPYATALPYIDTNRLSLLVLEGLTASLRSPIEAEMTGTREINKNARCRYERLIEAGNFGSIVSTCAQQLIQRIHDENKCHEVGFRRKNMAALLYMYFDDMTRVFQNLHEIVKPKGHICIVIGDTKTTTGKGLAIISTTEALRETGRAMGWRIAHDIPITVTRENYVHIENSIVENQILIFQKQ